MDCNACKLRDNEKTTHGPVPSGGNPFGNVCRRKRRRNSTASSVMTPVAIDLTVSE